MTCIVPPLTGRRWTMENIQRIRKQQNEEILEPDMTSLLLDVTCKMEYFQTSQYIYMCHDLSQFPLVDLTSLLGWFCPKSELV